MEGRRTDGLGQVVPGSPAGLAGSIVLVTGGGRGLGFAVAAAFVAAGAHVVIASRNVSMLELAVDELVRDARGRVWGLPVDITDELSLEALAERITAEIGPVETLINNAGVNPWYLPSEQTSLAQWREVIDVNLTGAFLGCRIFGRGMLERGRGSIINITSIAARVGLTRSASYCASKAGVESLTRALAIEWASKGVRVNAVAPGYFETELTAGVREHEVLSQRILSRTPMRRFGIPEEVAGACVFLASPAAAYITGQSIQVDGGVTAA